MRGLFERTHRFEPRYHRGITWGFNSWDTSYYPVAANARNGRPWPRTTIPRNLQARLRNSPRAVALGWEFPERWVRRWRRLSMTRGSRSSIKARLFKEIGR